jgi:TonB-linked SusC/RagA family outer membrane protein
MGKVLRIVRFKTVSFLLLMIFVNCATIQAQTLLSVKGTVTSATNEPLSGATVGVKGTTNAVITGSDGVFVIQASKNDVLQISLVGFESKEITVSEGVEPHVVLDKKFQSLDQVVVTALGIVQKEKSLSYASQRVNTESLTEIRAPENFLNSFQGKIANALITSGGLGSASHVVLRGNRSLTGNSDALIVVDGVPVKDASGINPDDIKSVNVLRGASGAALYGSEAGNGVIVITTKEGSSEKIQVGLNSGLVFESPFLLPDFQNVYGQGTGGVMDPKSGLSWGEKMTGQKYTNFWGEEDTYSPQPDNVKDYFNNGVTTNNSVSLSAGSQKMKGYFSYTNTDVKGIIPMNSLTSNNFNLRLNTKISKKLTSDVKITYFNRNISHNPRVSEGNRPILDIFNIQRNISNASAKKNFQTINNLGVPQYRSWPSPFPYNNPYWVTNYDINNIGADELVGFVHLKYQIADWLSITGRANLDKSLGSDIRNVFDGTAQYATRPGGYYSQITTSKTKKWFDAILEGNNNLSRDFAINYQAGGIFNDDRLQRTTNIANGLNVTNKFNLNFATTPEMSSNETEVQVQSVFGQASVSYKDGLFVNGSYRNDWDSRLASPHSFSYYSAGASAVLSQFMALPSFISFLKASIDYAEVGNGGQFGLLSTFYTYSQGVGNGYLARSSVLPFPDLKPEIVKNKEASIEAGFLKNRLHFTFTYYHSNSLNQLLSISLPDPTGFSSKYINAGNISNTGVELVLSATPVKNKQFKWGVDLNFGSNRNKVLSLTDGLEVIYYRGYYDFGGREQARVGGEYGDIYGYGWARDASGNYLVTNNGKPLTDQAAGNPARRLGNFNPRSTLSLSNSFEYKNMSLRILLDGRIGGIIVDGTEQNLSFSGLTKGTLDHREGGWNLGGLDTDGHAVGATISAQEFWQTVSGKRNGRGEFYTYDGTNFRIREIALGYSIPVPEKSLLKSAKISLVARNLFFIYRGSSTLDIPGLKKRKMSFDPDMTYRGVVYGDMPSTQSIGFNVNLLF